MSLEMLFVLLNSRQRTSDSALYRMKTPNRMTMAVCHTKQTTGRLTRTLVFLGRSHRSLKLWTQPILKVVEG